MCEVLSVSRSGFYKWTHDRDNSARAKRWERLLKLVQQIFDQSRQTYGIRRITAKLRKMGEIVNRKLVHRLVKKLGLQPRRKRRYKCTTDSKHSLPVAPNVLNRDFITNKPNEVWVGDITYIPTNQGWLYLAVFIDLYSRRVVGWSMAEEMTSQLVVDAFQMGVLRRGYVRPKVVHSDRGCQYASKAFRKHLKKVKQSMSRKGNCWDNAVAESFFGALKSEFIHRTRFETTKEARIKVFDYIEIFYNNQRLHSALGYLSPAEFEQKGKTAA
jgi:transposase InsO family protein